MGLEKQTDVRTSNHIQYRNFSLKRPLNEHNSLLFIYIGFASNMCTIGCETACKAKINEELCTYSKKNIEKRKKNVNGKKDVNVT